MIVVDASVGIKWLKQDEEDAEKAISLYKNHIQGKNSIVIPSLFFLEIANVLAMTKEIDTQTMEEGIQLINESNLTLHSFTKDNLREAALLAKEHSTTIYDMMYAVIAKEHKCTLVTADEKFARKCKFAFVTLLHNI